MKYLVKIEEQEIEVEARDAGEAADNALGQAVAHAELINDEIAEPA